MISLREQAMDYLSRREHSLHELTQKLIRKGYSESEVVKVVQQLNNENLQSDERFAESYIQNRIRAGYGPLRIKKELQQRGISDDIVSDYLTNDEGFWESELMRVWQKKFQGAKPQSQKEFAKQARFLMQRGYFAQAINQLLKSTTFSV